MFKSHHSIIFLYTAVVYGYSSQLIALPYVLIFFVDSLRTSAPVPLVFCANGAVVAKPCITKPLIVKTEVTCLPHCAFISARAAHPSLEK